MELKALPVSDLSLLLMLQLILNGIESILHILTLLRQNKRLILNGIES